MRRAAIVLARGVFLFALATPLSAQAIQTAPPEIVGLSSRRLARLDSVMQSYVDREHVAGAVALVARRGEIAHLEAYGMADVDAGRPMRTDAIFRIASMTKAVTSVAAMMLYEEGQFLLSSPIANLMPEFESPMVVVPATGKDSLTSRHAVVRAQRPITFRHLLTHTSGITYRFMAEFSGHDPITEHVAGLYRDAGVSDGLTQTDGTIGEMVVRLAAQPLLHQPGARFSYGLSTDVLGRAIEVASSMTLEEFFEQRIFEPLGMDDTHFFLPPAKVGRLAAVYAPSEGGGLTELPDSVLGGPNLIYSASYPYTGPRTYFSGGAGLSSTATDYARFLQMLLNGGELDGVRILSRKTVELMTWDHLGDVESAELAFGLGFSIEPDPGTSGTIGSPGAYGWGGFWNTRFWIDPEEELIGVIMTQVFPSGHTDMLDKFKVMVYQAIVD